MKTPITLGPWLCAGALLLCVGRPGAALAEDTAAPSAEVKVGTGYQHYAVVGEATTFAPGTMVFAVSTVSGANGTTVKHVWKKDGAELWTASLNIGASRWTTSSRRQLNQAGNYEVTVLSTEGTEIGKAEFKIQ